MACLFFDASSKARLEMRVMSLVDGRGRMYVWRVIQYVESGKRRKT